MNTNNNNTFPAMASPALSVRSDFSDMTDEELDLYLASCVPLSNLPTPPLAKQQQRQHPSPSTLPSPSSESGLERHRRSPELKVYALHLASLVPRSVDVAGQKPSVAAIEGFLERACLPIEMVAFAACVLEALSEAFAERWRDVLLPMKTSALDFYLGANCWEQPSASPDLIVLAAMALAHGFVDDHGRSNGHWARVVGMRRFSAKEVDKTKMCILQDIDYGLFRISEESIQQKAREMQQATCFTTPRNSIVFTDCESLERRPRLSLSTSSGAAVWAYGVQTPEPSP